jgi:flagellar motor switch protein FliM
MSRPRTQQEIDAVFQKQDRKRDTPTASFDFRRPDRIPESQLRAIHLLPDVFARNLVASLSAYLRSYLTVNLVSVDNSPILNFWRIFPHPPAWYRWG